MTKAKKPVRRGAAANHRAPKKAAKRKPIPSQVADGALQARAGKAKAVEREFGKRLTVEEQAAMGQHPCACCCREAIKGGRVDWVAAANLCKRKAELRADGHGAAESAKPGLIARIWRALTNREKASP